MKSARYLLRPTLCLFSVIVLWSLGTVGEEFLNLPILHRIRENLSHMPVLTVFFLRNFRVNAGDFVLSLSPFIVLMTVLGAASCDRRLSDLYWYFFVSVWLLAMAYFLVFVLALLAPFHLLAAVGG